MPPLFFFFFFHHARVVFCVFARGTVGMICFPIPPPGVPWGQNFDPDAPLPGDLPENMVVRIHLDEETELEVGLGNRILYVCTLHCSYMVHPTHPPLTGPCSQESRPGREPHLSTNIDDSPTRCPVFIPCWRSISIVIFRCPGLVPAAACIVSLLLLVAALIPFYCCFCTSLLSPSLPHSLQVCTQVGG